MARKTLGYAELQWTCPNCEGVNPGLEKTCGQCGAPQPEDVKFEQAQQAELRQDDEILAQVKAGPDIHCPYCGTRNPGDAEACIQCGGDLVEGRRRESGKVLGAYQAPSDTPEENIACPNCGTENPESAKTCVQCGANLRAQQPLSDLPATSQPGKVKRPPIGMIVVLVVICCAVAALIFFLTRTEATTGVVQSVGWERSIAIEGLGPVEYRDWIDQIPSEAKVGSCEQNVRSIESQPQPNSEEVCGTPYSVDSGSGVAEVVQDCEYQVYDDYCSYALIEWQVVDTASISGNDFYPEWPEPAISTEQRLGQQSESYTVYFDTTQGTLDYAVSNFSEYQQFQIGTQWNLEVNTLGGVVSVTP